MAAIASLGWFAVDFSIFELGRFFAV